MGTWQMGNPNVHADLHRRIEPWGDLTDTSREAAPSLREDEVLVITWTSTRHDVNLSYWVPNHFVPSLPCPHTQDKQSSNPPVCSRA